MTDKILIVTPPDDTLLQGIRLIHVNLTEDQGQIISEALLQANIKYSIINYVWKMGDKVDWLLDKIPKCDLIIFNAEGSVDPGREIIIGWVSAQPNSYYFGNLKDLHMANNNAIYSVEDILILLEKVSKNYEQI